MLSFNPSKASKSPSLIYDSQAPLYQMGAETGNLNTENSPSGTQGEHDWSSRLFG